MASDKVLLSRVALALFVFGIVVPQGIIAVVGLDGRADEVQQLAILGLSLSAFFALWSWGERVSKVVLVGLALFALMMGAVIFANRNLRGRERPVTTDHTIGPILVPEEREKRTHEPLDVKPY